MIFSPKYHTVPQIDERFGPWLQQAEARALEAWVNTHLQPESKIAQADWEQASESLRRLEEEWERCRSTCRPA